MSLVNCNVQGFLEVVSSEGIKLFNTSTIVSIKPLEISMNGLTKVNLKFITGSVYVGYIRECDVQVINSDDGTSDLIDLYESLIH